MQRLHFSISIDAPREHVYKTMLNKPTYEAWTEAFSPDPADGSTYEGSWDQGSTITFGDNSDNGMIATVTENRPAEFVSLTHHTMVMKGTEQRIDPPMIENYTFAEEHGKTTLDIDLEVADQYADEFKKMWPKALEKLKEITEESR